MCRGLSRLPALLEDIHRSARSPKGSNGNMSSIKPMYVQRAERHTHQHLKPFVGSSNIIQCLCLLGHAPKPGACMMIQVKQSKLHSFFFRPSPGDPSHAVSVVRLGTGSSALVRRNKDNNSDQTKKTQAVPISSVLRSPSCHWEFSLSKALHQSLRPRGRLLLQLIRRFLTVGWAFGQLRS